MRDSGPDRLFSPQVALWLRGVPGQQAAYFADAGFYFPATSPKDTSGFASPARGVNRPDRGGRPTGVKSARRPPVHPRGAPFGPQNAVAPL